MSEITDETHRMSSTNSIQIQVEEIENAVSNEDYVIVYDEGDQQLNKAMQIMQVFKRKLKEKGLSSKVVQSEDDKKRRYILITADNREVLTKRAEVLRVSVPIVMVKVEDMMKIQADQLDDDEVCVVPRTEIEGPAFKRKSSYSNTNSRCSIKLFVRDWFLPKLDGGHIKFDFQQKFDEVLFVRPQREYPDIFTQSSRVRSMIVHDLIKDIELTSDLRKIKHEEVAGDTKNKSHPYRGLEWLKRKGYVRMSFVPHSEKDIERFKKQRKEKHYKYPIQSVTSVRDYLGEKVAFAFAWRAAWLSWGLTIPAILGIVVFFVDVIQYLAKQRYKHLIDGASKSNSSNTTIHNYGLFDNEILPFYAFISMLLQIIGFTVGWPKYKFINSFKWGMLSYFLEKERSLVMNTTLKELKKTQTKFWYRMMSTAAGVLIIVGMVVFNFMVFAAQQVFRLYLTSKGADETVAFYSSTVVVSLVNTAFVLFYLNRKFAHIAKWLCDQEFHTFPSDYERFLTWKVFFYNFTANNMRLLLMTIAPKITLPFSVPNLNAPGENFNMEFCEEGKCVNTIIIQLVFFHVFKPLTSILGYRKDDIWRWCKVKFESFIACSIMRPYMPTRNCSMEPEGSTSRRLDKEFLLYESDRFGERNQTLMDMNDKVAQYGFTVLFGGVFPLSPLIAAVMEIYTRLKDVERYTKTQRRAVPRRYEGVGCWEEIIDLVNILAIITNVWIVVFRSTFVSQYSSEYPILSISLISGICFLVYVIRAMLQVHSIPEKVKRFKQAEIGAADDFLKSLLKQ
ncbi:hypothetical protein ACHWQZ_G000545 [Mnemiopsis leidyi]